MAARKKAKTRKPVRATRKGAGKARSGPQQIRAKLQRKVDVRIRAVTKLARGLSAQGLAPDEIAGRVRTELTGLGPDVMDDVLRLALNGIWVRQGGEV